MSIISVAETSSARTSTIDDRFIRTYTRSFMVVTLGSNVSEYVVRIAPGIPRVWDAYVSADGAIDLGCYCRSVSCKQVGPLNWEVTADYSSQVEDPDKQAENPLLRPADIKWSFAQYKRYITKDKNDDPIVNSAGLRFKEGIEVEDSRPVLSVTKNIEAFDINIALAYQNSINADAWWGVEPKVAKMQGIQASQEYENGVFFWRIQYEIHFNFETWVRKILDMGTMQKKGGKLENITDRKGSIVKDPWPLNEDGSAYAVDSTDEIRTLEFDVYREVNFSDLNLP